MTAHESQSETLKRLFRLMAEKKSGISFSLAALLLAVQLGALVFEGVSVALVLPLVELILSDDVAGNTSTWISTVVGILESVGLQATIPVVAGCVVVAMITRQIFIYCRLHLTAYIIKSMVSALRQNIFDSYLGSNLSTAEREQQGSIVNMLVAESERGTQSLMVLITLTAGSLQLLLYLGFLVAVSASMTGFAIGAMLLSALLLQRLYRHSHQLGHRQTDENKLFFEFITSRTRSLRLVRLSHTEDNERISMADANGRQQEVLYAQRKLTALLSVLIEPIMLVFGIGLFMAGREVIGLSLAEVTFFIMLLFRILPILKEVMVNRQTLLTRTPGLAALLDRLDHLKTSREIDNGTVELDVITTGITLQNVNFAYPPGEETDQEKPVLRDVSVTFPAGKVTAIVGPSGAGKSTLIDLLPALRRAQSGSVLLDGKDVSDYTLRSLRRKIGFVPQSPQLFNGSILDHIRYGSNTDSDGAIEDALRLASAEFVRSLPQGLDTNVGDGGSLLSGGQRQRVDLARAIAGSPGILILDEPTSALDPDSEQAMRASLRSLVQERQTTVILIGHRPSTVSIADKIVVLSDGYVEAEGTASEVALKSAWFRRNFGQKSLEDDDATVTHLGLREGTS